jgi:uncharacterized protein with HEPN domain
MRRDRERLADILEAIRILEPILALGRTAFDDDSMVAAVAERHLEIIGEAVAQLPQTVTNLQPQIPWEDIKGMRIKLAHVYWEIIGDTVWLTLENDLQPLKLAIQALLARPDIE